MTSENLKTLAPVDIFISKYWRSDGPFPLVNVPSELKVGDGDDSEVFKMPETNQVAKFYVRGPWRDQRTYNHLRFYRDVTNRASHVAETDDWRITFKKSKLEAKIRINPYDDLVWNQKSGCSIGICPFIEGPNLMSRENFGVLKKTLFPYETYNIIPDINLRIEKKLQVKGVDVFLMNMKLIEDKEGLVIMITDICRGISDLSREVVKNGSAV